MLTINFKTYMLSSNAILIFVYVFFNIFTETSFPVLNKKCSYIKHLSSLLFVDVKNSHQSNLIFGYQIILRTHLQVLHGISLTKKAFIQRR